MPDEITVADIKAALNKRELIFHYQPRVDFTTGRICGAESLLRWRKESGRIIPPGAFLPLAESSGIITDITAAMIHSLVKDMKAILAARPDLHISFNISAKDLCSSYLNQSIRKYLDAGDIEQHNLEIEITETAVVDNSERISDNLCELKSMGVDLVMDDYGTGYSSIDILSRLPFSVIKLDRGIVMRMESSSKNALIARDIILMAADLHLRTVAEGIETKGSYNFLLSQGYDEGQGFWMSRPLPLDAFLDLCTSNQSWFSSPYGQIFNAHLLHVRLRKTIMDSLFCLNVTPKKEWQNLPQIELALNEAECLEKLAQRVRLELDDKANVEQFAACHHGFHTVGEKLVRTARNGGSHQELKTMLLEMERHADILFAAFRKLEEEIALKPCDVKDSKPKT